MASFKEDWKKACESGKMGEILDEFGKRYEERKKEFGRK